MQNSIFHKLSDVLWGLIILILVVLALYVSVGRMLTNDISSYRAAILQELNLRVPFNIEAEAVTGYWRSFAPDIVLSGLRLTIPGLDHAPIELSEGRIGLDVLNSLRTRSLQVTRIELTDLNLQGELSEDGRFRLTGFAGGGSEMGQWLQELLLNVEHVSLRDNLLQLRMPNGEVRDFDLDLQLTREGSRRLIDGNLLSNAGTSIDVIAQGMGNPFKPAEFDGELYLNIRTSNLAAVRDLLAAGSPPVWADGQLDLQLWLDVKRGKTTLETSLEARDFTVSGDAGRWQVPLRRLAAQARIEEHRNHWRVYATDLQLEHTTGELNVPKLQLDVWQGAARLRAAQLSLAPMNDLLTSLDSVPDNLRDVFRVLQPHGNVAALQLNLGDMDNLAGDWELEANFDAVTVSSWRGAPGVTGATGYVELDAERGRVVLDSESISLSFPTVYRESLDYTELFGNIDLAWDAERFTLHSGLLTARGEEGTARVLFGLNVPLTESIPGIEMDLLVGLTESHPRYRAKYLPYSLDSGLLDWLRSSIGEGEIEAGAFLWRGSLRSGAGPMRTVQLAFNVADTELTYDPRWPPVDVQTGVVLINNTRVSVWSDRASIYRSDATSLSVETRVASDGDLMLDVRGQIEGPAGDGLKVVNESPLASAVGAAFANWRLEGELSADLRLRLNLSDQTALPLVDVATRWRDVSIDVQPGDLPLRNVSGGFSYSTLTGFSSSGLQASLWGEALQAELRQRHPSGSGGYDPGESLLEVAVDGNVPLASVRQWLQLEPLAFASGQTEAQVRIEIAPGQLPVLTVLSDLKGVTLDLPSPYGKSPDEQRQLVVEMPLGGPAQQLAIRLGEEVFLDMAVADRRLVGASLAFAESAPPIVNEQVRITGRAQAVPLQAWLSTVERYFAPQATLFTEAVTAAADSNAVISRGEVLATERSGGVDEQSVLAVVVSGLDVRTLDVYGRRFENVLIDLMLAGGDLDLAIQSDWLEADLSLTSAADPARLDIAQLDLAGMPELTPAEDQVEGEGTATQDSLSDAAEWASLTLPDAEVSVLSLRSADQTLGSLAFNFMQRDGDYLINDLQGELYGFRFADDRTTQMRYRSGSEGFTSLSGAVRFGDLGESLTALGYQPVIQTRSGALEVDLTWPGGPNKFSLSDGRGELQLQIGEGSFPEAPAGASGAVRVVSILNLVDMVGRLSLAHMFESGIPFDSVVGQVYLDDGVIDVVQMDISGSATFEFSGVSDVNARTLDGELVATLPVAKNLPWVAALAGGLPVAAGVFVVSQIFDNQFNRLTSAVYGIGGTWDDPQVGFNRLFDTRQVRSTDRLDESRQRNVAPDPQEPSLPLDSEFPGMRALDIFVEDPNRPTVGFPVPDRDQSVSDSASVRR